MNRELIKLQQKMRQIVSTKEERYIELGFKSFTKVVLVEGTEMLLKLDLLGAESPVIFNVEITDNSKADLKMYLSTDCSEPSEKNNQKAVDRMKSFKFTAEKKAQYFENDETCYIMMFSSLGCTVKVMATSNRIRGLAEPDKIKEFNKALTKAEMAAGENAVKKKELYILELEGKYEGKWNLF